MRANISLHDYERISAYLDGQLPVREKTRFEQQLRDRPDLKMAFEEMSRTRALLRMAPRRRAPRNFTLTPAMVQQSKPKQAFGFNLFPALRFASALAALALVATFLFELMPGVSPSQSGAVPEAARGSESTTMMQPLSTAEAQADALKSAPGIAAAPERQAGQPPVITWGFPPVTNWYGTMPGYGGGPGLDTMGRGGGGGGGGGSIAGMGGGAPDGNLVVPLDSAQALIQPAEQGSPQLQDFGSVPMLEGAGPILGLPPADQAGLYAQPLPTALPPRDLSGLVEEPAMSGQAVEETQPGSLSNLRWAQIALGTIAVITGLAAFLIWRRLR